MEETDDMEVDFLVETSNKPQIAAGHRCDEAGSNNYTDGVVGQEYCLQNTAVEVPDTTTQWCDGSLCAWDTGCLPKLDVSDEDFDFPGYSEKQSNYKTPINDPICGGTEIPIDELLRDETHEIPNPHHQTPAENQLNRYPSYPTPELHPDPSRIRDDSCELSAGSANREAEIDKLVDYIKRVIETSCSINTDETSSKVKVHEVILVILLNQRCGDQSMDLRRILTFCDEMGCEILGESWHFKTLDTETMGLLWMKIKGNSKPSYDTFCRAMRVRREKSEGYFDYLASGMRTRKRVYRFGEKTMSEMKRIKKTLMMFAGQ